MAAEETTRLRRDVAFRRFWAASTVSVVGDYVTALAIGVLVVRDLDGTATDVGWANAARWLPHLTVGLVVGVLADRARRKPLLVATDLGRAALLALVPALAAAGHLTLGALLGLLAGYGLLSVAHDAAHQSFLPRLLPGPMLRRGNTRLQQSDAVAQTTAPLLAGGIVAWAGAPLAVLVDAATYLASALLIARTPVADPRPTRSSRRVRSVLPELHAGVRWVYGHPTLRPLALSTHVWFLFNGLLGTVYVVYALVDLDIGATGLGVTGASAGVGALLGTSASERLGRRLGTARTVVAARLVEAAGFAVVAVLPGAVASAGPVSVIAAAGLGQFLFGLGLGAEGPIELSYRQAMTPDALQGRMNATMRSLNRSAIVVGAPAGGALAGATSARAALLFGSVGIAGAALALACSGFRLADDKTGGDDDLA